MTELRWVELTKQSLPGLVAEGELPAQLINISGPADGEWEICAAMAESSSSLKPVVVVLNARSARESLAWLATYSPASFPISQSARIMTSEDFASSPHSLNGRKLPDDLSYWPSIVFGELLGQGEQLSSLDAVSLSRVNACFSFAQARAAALHGWTSSFSQACSNRLKIIENDGLFVKRSISIEELSPVWDWTRPQPPENAVQRDLSRIVEGAVSGQLSKNPAPADSLLGSVGFDAIGLSSGPAEARVRAYQTLAHSLENVRIPDTNRASAMLLAAAAVCVGNGTSHISLLDDFSKKVPAAYAWFGLFAAIAGQQGWDPLWTRAVNSVSRSLRSGFELADPPTFDLSWVEYDFVREVAKPSEFLKHVPKLFPKSLSIEVAPGAQCQLRLRDDLSPSRPTPRGNETIDPTPQRQANVARPLPSEWTSKLNEAERAISHAQSLIRQLLISSEAIAPDQGSLFDTSTPKPKRRSSKKGNKLA